MIPDTEQSSLHEVKSSSNRVFGLVFTVFFMVVALLPLWHGSHIRYWALIISGMFFILALIAPSVLSPFNRWWTQLGQLLHHVTSPVALGILFYGVVVPTGLLIRLFGKDPLHLKFDHSAKSYWIDRAPSEPTPESLNNQF